MNLSPYPNDKNSTMGTKLGWEEETDPTKYFQTNPSGFSLSF